MTIATKVRAFQKDGWNFADEDEGVPTWADDIKEQAPDLVMFTAFATLAMVGFSARAKS